MDELLNETMFRNLTYARIVIRDWAHDYKANRPHSALGYETPEAFVKRLFPATGCTLRLLNAPRSRQLPNPRQMVYQHERLWFRLG